MRDFAAMLMFISLLLTGSRALAQSSTSDEKSIRTVSSLADRIKACESSEQTAKFKNRWAKVAWGPPSNVKFDVTRTTSLLYPYVGTIQFEIPYATGEHHKLESDAEADHNLHPLFRFSVRYEIRISSDGNFSVERMQSNSSLSGEWHDYKPIHPERFCWIATLN